MKQEKSSNQPEPGSIDVVNEFLRRYEREYDFYQEVSRQCAQRLETALEQNAIRAIVTWRAKRSDRLRTKVEKRYSTKNYATTEQVFDDIVDLAGVRVALYFPADRKKVNQIIDDNFELCHAPKDHFPPHENDTYKKIFQGYQAVHYRVKLRADGLGDTQQRYADAAVEVQVASVLMHAWSEVEHDLVYKPFSGDPSVDEHAILDQLNGLVMTGEVALESLQRAVQARMNKADSIFKSHYDLAAYIYDAIRPLYDNDTDDPVIGRVDVLYRFLALIELLKPEELRRHIERVTPHSNGEPISEQLVDLIISEDLSRIPYYICATDELMQRNPYRSSDDEHNQNQTKNAVALLKFITLYNMFSSAISDIYHIVVEGGNARATSLQVNELLTYLKINRYIRMFHEAVLYRNSLVHQKTQIDETELNRTIVVLRDILTAIQDNVSEEARNRLTQAISEFSTIEN
ncbi:MAG: RelA/SpoT domain-containing protein [Capsulimonas sp.]|uniref:RelA/SpoT domain-containing protein n=1 Tax=Capsulimonas sp. TaxID=2494211 RepID=UPI003264B7E8